MLPCNLHAMLAMDAALESLRRQHHALLPPYLLKLPPPLELAQELAQVFLVERILNDPILQGKNAERGYERGFWRKIISEVERGLEEVREAEPDSELEVDERLYEALAASMVCSPDDSSLPKASYRTFIYDDPFGGEEERRVTLLEEQVAIQAGTTGLRTWTASLHLAHHILQNPHILIHPRHPQRSQAGPSKFLALPPCIELGAGTGFLSILLAQLGLDVISTDLDGTNEAGRHTPLQRLRDNVELNEVNGNLTVESLDWMDALNSPEDRPEIWHELGTSASGSETNTPTPSPRTVVAADVIYDPDLIPPLVASIHALLEPCVDNIAMVAATLRNPETLALFIHTCHSAGLLVEDLSLAPMNPDHPTFWDSALDRTSDVRIIRISIQENG